MPELGCRTLCEWMDENVGGTTSWVEFGPRLAPEQQAHFAACPACRERCLQLLELERQLLTLREEPLPELDLTAGVMARLQVSAPIVPEAAQGFSWWAWAPLFFCLALFLPEPAGLPQWLAWSWSWPQLQVPNLELPIDSSFALLFAVPLALLASWKGRAPRHA